MFDVEFSVLSKNYAEVRADLDALGFADYPILHRSLNVITDFAIKFLSVEQKAKLLKQAHSFKAIHMDVIVEKMHVCSPIEIQFKNGRFDVDDEDFNSALSAFMSIVAYEHCSNLRAKLKNLGIDIGWPYPKFTVGETALMATKYPKTFISYLREEKKLYQVQDAIRGKTEFPDMLFPLFLLNAYAATLFDRMNKLAASFRDGGLPDGLAPVFFLSDADVMFVSPRDPAAKLSNYANLMFSGVVAAAFGIGKIEPVVFERKKFLDGNIAHSFASDLARFNV